MVTDMLARIENFIINIAEIAEIKTAGKSYSETNSIVIIYKSGKESILNISESSYKNLMEYFNTLCPDFNDDYTRKNLINAVVFQRSQFMQKMMQEGALPKSDFPDKVMPKNHGAKQ
jgi:hypothetical protein